jgi:hypothetical protein
VAIPIAVRQSRMVCLAVAAIGIAGCTHPDDVLIGNTPKPCGVWTTDKYFVDSTNGVFGGISGFATGVADGQRVYSWSYQVSSMCVSSAKSDNAIQFDVALRGDVPPTFSVSGFIYGSVFDQEPMSAGITRGPGLSRAAFTGLVQNLDLAGISTDGKSASVLVEVQVSFPTTGTAAGDLDQLKAKLLSIRMETFYHRYVGP